MPLIIPPSVNYPSPLHAIPSLVQDEPIEGRQQIPVEILWGSMGGSSLCVSLNIQDNATLNISQISTLKVDNSLCGADVTFIFPNTQETISVPAYSPCVVVPVFSQSMNFFVSSPNAEPEDITRFQILNYKTYPTDVPASVAQESKVVLGISMLVDGTTVLLANGISGTVEAISVTAAIFSSVAFQNQFQIQDGSGAALMGSGMGGTPIGGFTTFSGPVVELSNLDLRFVQGLNFVLTSVNNPNGVAQFFVNLFYRTP